jgi:hypothetical protein
MALIDTLIVICRVDSLCSRVLLAWCIMYPRPGVTTFYQVGEPLFIGLTIKFMLQFLDSHYKHNGPSYNVV